MDEIYAKRLGDDFETLDGHIGRCMKLVNGDEYAENKSLITKLVKDISIVDSYSSYLEEKILDWSINSVVEYHDMGKKDVIFQDKIRTNSDVRFNHSLYSVLYWIKDMDLDNDLRNLKTGNEVKGYFRWQYLLSTVISSHHSKWLGINNVKGLESRIKFKLEDDDDLNTNNLTKMLGVWAISSFEKDISIEEYSLLIEVHKYLREIDHRASLIYEVATMLSNMPKEAKDSARFLIKELDTRFNLEEVDRNKIIHKYLKDNYEIVGSLSRDD